MLHFSVLVEELIVNGATDASLKDTPSIYYLVHIGRLEFYINKSTNRAQRADAAVSYHWQLMRASQEQEGTFTAIAAVPVDWASAPAMISWFPTVQKRARPYGAPRVACDKHSAYVLLTRYDIIDGIPA